MSKVLATIFIFFSIISVSQADITHQYNGLAGQYSAMFADNNQESIRDYFNYFDDDMKNMKLLDLGCGDGYDLQNFNALGAEIYGIDASHEMVELAQKNNPLVDVQMATFEKLPFDDNTFDIVTSKWALQTAENIDVVYQEVARVLKPKGRFVFLSSHPLRQFIEKKKSGKNYFKKELVESYIFDNSIKVIEPSHTFEEYFSPSFLVNFTIQGFEEGFDSGAEQVNGDYYPAYFILDARLKA